MSVVAGAAVRRRGSRLSRSFLLAELRTRATRARARRHRPSAAHGAEGHQAAGEYGRACTGHVGLWPVYAARWAHSVNIVHVGTNVPVGARQRVSVKPLQPSRWKCGSVTLNTTCCAKMHETAAADTQQLTKGLIRN